MTPPGHPDRQLLAAPRNALAAGLHTAELALIARVAPSAGAQMLEFFAAEISNTNTRRAYWKAAEGFFRWCDHHSITLDQVLPIHVAAYRELLVDGRSPATVKQRLSALRTLCDYLVAQGVLRSNPAAAVRPPRLQRSSTQTPAMLDSEAHELLAHLARDPDLAAARDRALIAVMLYTFARVGAVCLARVGDYDDHRRRRFLELQAAGGPWQRTPPEERCAFLTLFEKGGKERRLPVHSHAAEILDAWLDLSRLRCQNDLPLFQGFAPNRYDLSGEPLSTRQALRIVKARAIAAGLSPRLRSHSCRATGITAFLRAGGALEQAAYMAGHVNLDTTKGYDRRPEAVAVDQLERVRF